MDAQFDLAELEERLNSNHLEIQAHALDESRDLIRAITKAAVSGLAKTDNPVIYADHLSALGPVIIPDLESLWNNAEAGEARTQVAMLLLFLGNSNGVADVLGALSIENPNHCLAASKLANANVRTAIVPITNLLRVYANGPLTDPMLGPNLGALIHSLEKLDGAIPEDVREKLLAPDTHRFIKAYLHEQ